jgi:hypothetical protein
VIEWKRAVRAMLDNFRLSLDNHPAPVTGIIEDGV